MAARDGNYQEVTKYQNRKGKKTESRGLGLLSNCRCGCCVVMEEASSLFFRLQPLHLPSGVEIITHLLGVFLHNTCSAEEKKSLDLNLFPQQRNFILKNYYFQLDLAIKQTCALHMPGQCTGAWFVFLDLGCF